MAIRRSLGNFFDSVGTKYNLPELGLSEFLSGGKTANTGRKNIAYQPAINYFTGAQAADPGSSFDANYIRQNWQTMGYSDLNQALVDNGFPAETAAGAPTPAPVATGTRSTGTRAVSSPTAAPTQQAIPEVFNQPLNGAGTPEYVFFQGNQYNVADPTERANLFKVRNQAIKDAASRQIGDYEGQVRSKLDEANRLNARELEGIDTDLADLDRTEQEANRTYDRSIYDTNENYDLGTVKRSNYFAQLSPNAFQSSQGTSQQYANNQRLQALGDIDVARTGTLNDINTNRAGLQRSRGDLASAYDQYIQQTQGDLGRYSTDVNDYYNGQLDQTRGEFTGYDKAAGINEFRFNRDAFNPVNVQTADLSKYTPYLNFNQLSQSPEANFFRTNAPTKTATDPRDQYLGYKPDDKEKDYLRQYLTRGY